MAFYNTQALVLTSVNVGEADRIITLLTYERGRVRTMVRGARRPRNRFAALAQPLNLIEVQLSGNTALENLTQGQLVNNYRTLKESLDRLAYAQYLLELFDKSTEGASDVAEVFIMLLTALELIQYSENLILVRLAVEMKLLAAIGLRPQLESCILCQEKLDNKKPLYYNYDAGGFCCSHCSPEGNLLCSPSARELLLYLQQVSLARLPTVAAEQTESAVLQEAATLLQHTWGQHLGAPPKSLEFLQYILPLQP
ncbi:MAG: DNA repair protein RecO [Symbiobacteriaceae bacterium]|nr:DNA repair protein RecO [Symbiobacteriaceae bacterium]